MTTIKIKGKEYVTYPLCILDDDKWGHRSTMEINLPITYQEAKETFTANAPWSYVDAQPDLEPVEHDCSDYCVVCQIAENMDGTTTITMGKMTAQEILDIVLGGKTV